MLFRNEDISDDYLINTYCIHYTLEMFLDDDFIVVGGSMRMCGM